MEVKEAGLRFIIGKLLTLPNDVINEGRRSTWQRILSELPEIPTIQVDGDTRICFMKKDKELFRVPRTVAQPVL